VRVIGNRAQKEEVTKGVCIEPRENFREHVDKSAKSKQTFTQTTNNLEPPIKIEEVEEIEYKNEYEGQMVDGKREGRGIFKL